MGKSQELYLRAKKIIPGGTQLLSKRPEMFLPDQWPAYYNRAKGCEIWDLDGKHYYDMGLMGVGANVLGYANDEVDTAVIKAIKSGTNSTLNCPEEIKLAEMLCSIHPWAEMVRYARTGGEAMTIAVRIARAKTGKSKILFCGYHGWHDWYLTANLSEDKLKHGHLLPGLEPNGVPVELLNTSTTFQYNNTEEFLRKLSENNDQIACVVMESVRNFEPEKEFLNTLRNETRETGNHFNNR